MTMAVHSRLAEISRLVGNTPTLPITIDETPGVRYWIKLEGCNPTGSIKDRACVQILHDAIESGHLKPGMTILDASSGNMACALAYYGRVLGYEVTVVCSEKLTDEKASFVKYFGATLIRHGKYTIDGNQFCLNMAWEKPREYCFLDQLHNWSNPSASYRTLAREIVCNVPAAIAVVGSLGSGGSMFGVCSRLVKEGHPALRVAVEAASGTSLPGTIGIDDGDYVTPFIKHAYLYGAFDLRRKTTTEEAIAYSAMIADRGVFAGLQTGGVFAAAVRVAKDLDLSGDIVVISGDTGWKNMSKLCGAS